MRRGDMLIVAIARSIDGEWVRKDGKEGTYPFFWAGRETRGKDRRKPWRLVIGGMSFNLFFSNTKTADKER